MPPIKKWLCKSKCDKELRKYKNLIPGTGLVIPNCVIYEVNFQVPSPIVHCVRPSAMPTKLFDMRKP